MGRENRELSDSEVQVYCGPGPGVSRMRRVRGAIEAYIEG